MMAESGTSAEKLGAATSQLSRTDTDALLI
jgi:hypothetical protein